MSGVTCQEVNLSVGLGLVAFHESMWMKCSAVYKDMRTQISVALMLIWHQQH